jgi:hypothetical protein
MHLRCSSQYHHRLLHASTALSCVDTLHSMQCHAAPCTAMYACEYKCYVGSNVPCTHLDVGSSLLKIPTTVAPS